VIAAHKCRVGVLISHNGDLYAVAETNFVECRLLLVARFDGVHFNLAAGADIITIDGQERIAPFRNKSIQFAFPR
jgi:hypothetical protein